MPTDIHMEERGRGIKKAKKYTAHKKN